MSGYLLPDYCREEATHTHAYDHSATAHHVNRTQLGDEADDGGSEPERVVGDGSGRRGSVHDGLCLNPDFEAGMLTFGEQEVEQVR